MILRVISSTVTSEPVPTLPTLSWIRGQQAMFVDLSTEDGTNEGWVGYQIMSPKGSMFIRTR